MQWNCAWRRIFVSGRSHFGLDNDTPIILRQANVLISLDLGDVIMRK